MKAVSVGTAMWIDVDTPMAHAFAEESIARYGEQLWPEPASTVVARRARG
jgi:hypothetical protein